MSDRPRWPPQTEDEFRSRQDKIADFRSRTRAVSETIDLHRTDEERQLRAAFNDDMTPEREAAIRKHIETVLGWADDARHSEVARYVRATSAERRNYGQRIREMRKARGLKTQRDFAARADVNVETISRIENGENVQVDTLAKVFDAIMTDLDYPPYAAWRADREQFLRRLDALAFSDAKSEQQNKHFVNAEPTDIDVSGYTKNALPVIAEGDASPQPNLFWTDDGVLASDVEDRMSRPHDVRDPKAYGVRVRGDSMAPAYRPGMLVVVSPNTPPNDGDEVYVQLLSGERLLKVARRLPGGWLLESYNPAYESRFVQQSEIGAMHVVLWARRTRRGERVV